MLTTGCFQPSRRPIDVQSYDYYTIVHMYQGWRKQFPIGQAKIQIVMSAWVALEHTSQENSCPEILAEI